MINIEGEMETKNQKKKEMANAYLGAFSALLPELAGAIVFGLRPKRENWIQTDFRNALFRCYNQSMRRRMDSGALSWAGLWIPRMQWQHT